MKLRFTRVLALLGMALPVFAQYAGPALLTRGEAPVAMASPEISFRPFFDFSAVYDTGLAAIKVSEKGELANASSVGLNFGWGVSGTHSWRHTKLGLDYRGGATHYSQQTAFDSVNQALLLGITHQITRHITATVNESAGIFSRNFGLTGLPQTVPFDPSTNYVPTTDFFDNRTMYLSTTGNLSIQRSARLSFSMGGGNFLVRRRSDSLAGTTGTQAQGDVQYRLSRASTIGASYQYQHYGFTHFFGGTDAHAISGTYARRLSRQMEFSGYAGVVRVESKFTQALAIDPQLALLLGITQGSQTVHSIAWEPNISGRLSRAFQQGVAYVSGGHSVTPGNGLFLTSYATSFSAGYSYTGLRRWSFGSDVNYTRSRSIGNILGDYRNLSANLSMSRQIVPTVHFVTSLGARRYTSTDFANYNRVIYAASFGIGWAPGDVPLRVW